MENLKTRRAPIRAGFTRLYNSLKEKLQDAEVNIEDLQLMLEQLISKGTRLQNVDEEILDQLSKADISEEEYNAEYETCEAYVEKLIEMKTRIKSLVIAKQEPKNSISKYSKEENSDSYRCLQSGLKLPKINLIEFDGDPRNWLNFWTCFSKIHEDRNLDEYSKFVYLLNCTTPKSKAREIVRSYPTTNENYSKVIEHLKNRFGREDNLIQLYIRDLLQLVLSNNSGVPKKDLSSLYDSLETKLRALESLGVTQDKYASIIFPLVESCLPPETLRVWEREREKSKEGKENLDSILDFLKNEVLSEERMLLARHSFGFDKPKKASKNHNGDDFNVPTCNDLWVGDKNNKNSAPNKKIDELCAFCDKSSHPTEKCFKANELSYEDRKKLIFKKGLCFVCLKRNHVSKNCHSKVKCFLCSKRHVTVMCQRFAAKSKTDKEPNSTPEVENVLTNRVVNSNVLLQTLVVRLKNGKREKVVRAIIDTGSEKSYLTQDIIQYLKYESVGKTNLIHKLFGGVETKEKAHNMYKVNVNNFNNEFSCNIYCLDVPTICTDVKCIPKGPWLQEIKENDIRVTDIQGVVPGMDNQIKLLIGSDVAGKLFTGNIKCLVSGPVAMQTHLGWVLMGKMSECKISDVDGTCSCVSLLLNERAPENLWKLDIIGINDPVETQTKAELQQESMNYFTKNLSVDQEGRYEVALPWTLDCSRLPSNKELAERRLNVTRKKLVDSNKLDVYQEVFDTWLNNRIIEEVQSEKGYNEHYLPHRPVFKESSEFSKVRPVFDASAHIKGSVSLNDCLEKGPNLIEIIPSLLNRFRKYELGVISDIEKAFLQIGIREKDRDFLRFLWNDPNGEGIKIFRHRRVVFGLTCSPFLLSATLNFHLENAPNHMSDTAEILKESFYVDNCVTSFRTIEELNEFVVKSKLLLSLGKFNLRGWLSNGESEIIPRTGLVKNAFVLGLDWGLKEDTLSCRIGPQNREKIIATKRNLLSCTNKLFDPIGFTSPVTLFPKLILQECWKLKLNWDENLPTHLEKRFSEWVENMHLVAQIRIPRWIDVGRSQNQEVSLHVFCDASKHAYATSIFLRVKTEEQISVNFIQARARIAPLKNVTIPRLELLSCSIGARLASTVIADLNIPELSFYFWSDSTTALSWIKRDVRWGTFVWNRVEEIRRLSNVEDWHHIRSEFNQADLPSRGCSVEHFLQSKWWEGPKWLTLEEEKWPKSEIVANEELVNSEKKKSVLAAASIEAKYDGWYYRYFSKYPKIVRMIAWILRFLDNVRKRDVKKESDLSYFEIQKAERTLFMLIQKESFAKYEEKSFKNLSPIVDEHGILRVKTQVMYRQDTNDFKYPVLLPSEHPVVHLLISWKHIELLHAGVSLLMTSLREHFWITKARKTIRSVINRCVQCKRFDAKKTESVPIALPAERVQDVAAFQVVGVDLAGPLYLKKAEKSWIVLYTCAVYRAVHLELVTSLSTEAFLQSFRRFIARRGRPFTVYSDNGKNFVGANSAFATVDWAHVSSVSALQRIQWKFNPPSAAWWGGWWERLIQSVKRILRRVLGRASLSYEELLTVLCDCEQMINARPLTYVTEDPEDLTPLTPGMFLQQLGSSEVSDIDFVDSQNLNSRLKYVHEVREHLRKRFRNEYLGQLKQQMCNPKKLSPLSVNDVVLVESDQKRTHWALARVIELIPGRDGNPRVARLKTQSGEFVRPFQRIYNLEVQKSDLLSEPILRTRSGRQVVAPERLQL